MAKLQLLSKEDLLHRVLSTSEPYQKDYLAMYSSIWGGVIQHGGLMCVPIDDHMVHRGDGVFEAIKCVQGRVYGLKAHLERLKRSAEQVSLPLPSSLNEIADVICSMIALVGAPDCLIRLYVSRGPGGFTTNPYECIGSQLYIVLTRLKEPKAEVYENGARLATSKVEMKSGFFARIKSCNYLPNVLMKKEAVDLGVDFTVTVDENGVLGEGSTENIGFLMPGRRLVIPEFTRTLQGITVSRILHLIEPLVAAGELMSAETGNVKLSEALEAEEVFMFGTTLDVMPITEWDGKPIGLGRSGPWAKRLLRMLRDDIAEGNFSTHVEPVAE